MKLARDFTGQGGGGVAILHDLNLTAMVADAVTALSDGHLAAKGGLADMLNEPVLTRVFSCPLRVGVTPVDGCYVLRQSADETYVG